MHRDGLPVNVQKLALQEVWNARPGTVPELRFSLGHCYQVTLTHCTASKHCTHSGCAQLFRRMQKPSCVPYRLGYNLVVLKLVV
jgi:hypothetical protein